MKSSIESIMKRIELDGDCHIWTGAMSHQYGKVLVGGKRLLVHRYLYELRYGPIPTGMFLCHKCDRPACVNPEHMFVGTCKDNMQDASNKGRLSTKRIWAPRYSKSPDAIWKMVDKSASGCWNWLGHIDVGGYGALRMNGKKTRAHRHFYEWLVGPIDDGISLRHTCDNTKCVNPEHLIPGTQKDNVHDSISRGRKSMGESHSTSKLTNEQVLEIASSDELSTELSKKYSVNRTTVDHIRSGKSWGHITGITEPREKMHWTKRNPEMVKKLMSKPRKPGAHIRSGSEIGNARFSMDEVRLMRGLRNCGHTLKDLAAQFKCNVRTVAGITLAYSYREAM